MKYAVPTNTFEALEIRSIVILYTRTISQKKNVQLYKNSADTHIYNIIYISIIITYHKCI